MFHSPWLFSLLVSLLPTYEGPGNLTAVELSDGAVVQRIEYDVFGRVLSDT